MGEKKTDDWRQPICWIGPSPPQEIGCPRPSERLVSWATASADAHCTRGTPPTPPDEAIASAPPSPVASPARRRGARGAKGLYGQRTLTPGHAPPLAYKPMPTNLCKTDQISWVDPTPEA